MCFTVALVRKNKLVTALDYYNDLPVKKKSDFELPEFYFVNGFSHPLLPVYTSEELILSEWGLIPSWVKNIELANEIRNKTLNAMGETVFQKPSFKNNIVSHRCLLPVTGFFEWQDRNGLKYPYFIELTDVEHFSLGAIFDIWTDFETGENRHTFSIVTTQANPKMEKIHNLKKRMPLILSNEDEEKWLDNSLKISDVNKLIKPFPEEKMNAFTISRKANDGRINRNFPEICEPENYSEMMELF